MSAFNNFLTSLSRRSTSTMSTPRSLDALFPIPARYPPSHLAPSKLPGVTAESTQTLLRLLRENQKTNHIFFNDKGFHNHVTHHILAVYALGANSQLIEAAYDTHRDTQRPAFDSPGPITSGNFSDHLGEEKYYQAYFAYFAEEVLKKGSSKALVEYIFSKSANYDDGAEREGRKQKEMLSRFLGGLLHPMIHLGYGLEFGLPYMVTEALAQTAVVAPRMSSVIPRSYWDDEFRSGINSIVSRVSSLVLNTPPQKASPAGPGEVTAFNVIAMIQKDPAFSAKALGINDDGDFVDDPFYHVLDNKGIDVSKYSDMWSLNIAGNSNIEQELERKIEELALAATIMYGAAGWKGKNKHLQADFNLMHLVTSSLFLPSVCAYLPPHAIQLLLRTYFSSALAVWISRGRPTIRITQEFIDSTSPAPQEPNTSLKPAKDTLTPQVTSPNPWLAIAQSVLEHPADHMPKIQRSLMHWSSLYGGRPAGDWVGGKENLEGIELLDGTIFARVAGLTADSLGWMREGQEQGAWSFEMFSA